jgi:hypothetical protein
MKASAETVASIEVTASTCTTATETTTTIITEALNSAALALTLM